MANLTYFYYIRLILEIIGFIFVWFSIVKYFKKIMLKSKIKRRVSKWYRYPHIPSWANKIGKPFNTVEDVIENMNLKNGTKYKIITKEGYFKIIIKHKRTWQK